MKQSSNDQALYESLLSKLAHFPEADTSSLSIRVRSGSVTVKGCVSNQKASDQIKSQLASVDGVTSLEMNVLVMGSTKKSVYKHIFGY